MVSEGETGWLPFDLRNILAPWIIAWRQRLGGTSPGIVEVAVGLVGFTLGAAEAIALAYEALATGGLAGGSVAGGVEVVARSCEMWAEEPPDLATFLLGEPSLSDPGLAAEAAAAAEAANNGVFETDLYSIISVRTNEDKIQLGERERT